MKPLVAILAVSWAGFWFTPDQQGRRLFYRGEYAEAAKAFHDPDVAGNRLVSRRGLQAGRRCVFPSGNPRGFFQPRQRTRDGGSI